MSSPRAVCLACGLYGELPSKTQASTALGLSHNLARGISSKGMKGVLKGGAPRSPRGAFRNASSRASPRPSGSETLGLSSQTLWDSVFGEDLQVILSKPGKTQPPSKNCFAFGETETQIKEVTAQDHPGRKQPNQDSNSVIIQ